MLLCIIAICGVGIGSYISYVSKEYEIVVTQSDNGEISPETTFVKTGKNASFNVKAEDSYQIDRLIIDGEEQTLSGDNIDSKEYTFNNVTSKHSISAIFKKKAFAVSFKSTQNNAAYTILHNGEEKSANEKVEWGESFDIKITPPEGYEIALIKIGETEQDISEVSADDSKTIEITEIKEVPTITVEYKAKKYELLITGDGGSVKVNELEISSDGKYVVEYAQRVKLKATSDTEKMFNGFYIGDSKNPIYETDYTFTMTAGDCEVEAKFVVDNRELFDFVQEGDVYSIKQKPSSSLGGEVIIPYADKDGKKVTSIKADAFLNNVDITSIDIPNTIKRIGASAFKGCTGLKSVTLSNSLERIGASAFEGCTGLKSVTLSNSLKKIGASAFKGCTGLESVSISDSIEEIGDYAFQDCSKLISVYIEKDKMPEIGETAFAGCNQLTTIYVPENYENNSYKPFRFYEIGGKELAIVPASVTNLNFTLSEDEKYYKVSAKDTISGFIGFMPSYEGKPVTTIEAFKDCTGLEGVFIPEGITTIKSHAFLDCENLSFISIPSGLTSVEDYAFINCERLKSIMVLGNAIPSFDSDAFEGSGINIIYVTDKFKVETGEEPIVGKTVMVIKPTLEKLKLTLSEDEKHYIASAKDKTIAGEVFIPDYYKGLPITDIDNEGFKNCEELTSIHIPSNISSISNDAFQGCTKLTMITVVDGNTCFSSDAGVLFNKDKTELISYPAGKDSKSYTIPASVSKINSYAFFKCGNLTAINVDSENKDYESQDGVLFNKGKTDLISYPTGKTDIAYKVPKEVETINALAFAWNTSIKTITFAEESNLSSIGASTFYYCKELISISMPDSVSRIDNYAFYGCKGLTYLDIPSGASSLGQYVLGFCSNLKSITISSTTMPTISANAFCDSVLLKTIYVPEEFDSRYEDGKEYSFGGVEKVKISKVSLDKLNFTLSADGTYYIASAKEIEENDTAKKDTSISGNIIIPQTYRTLPVTSISDNAFKDCADITGVIIPNSVTTIGANAFNGCTKLANITVPNTLTYIGQDAFKNTAWYNAPANWEGEPKGTGVLYLTASDNLTKYLIKCGGTRSDACEIGKDVKVIADAAFMACGMLTEIKVDSKNTYYSSEDGVLFNYEKTTLIRYPSKKSGSSYTVPLTVTKVSEGAFYNCAKLTEIIVAESNANYSSEDGVLFNKDKTELICYPQGKTQASYTVPAA